MQHSCAALHYMQALTNLTTTTDTTGAAAASASAAAAATAAAATATAAAAAWRRIQQVKCVVRGARCKAQDVIRRAT